MRQMEGLIKFLRYLLISSILFTTSCNSSVEIVDEVEESKKEEQTLLLTREDSVLQLAKELNIAYDPTKDNINDVLDRILIQKRSLIARLDSLDSRADAMEMAAIKYKKKENKKVRNELLAEIDRIKTELDRIKELSGLPDEVVKKDENSIPEVKVPIQTESFEDLPAGNYITRIDKYHVVSIRVLPNGSIYTKVIEDSTTVIEGGRKLSPRITKELQQIKSKIKNQE